MIKQTTYLTISNVITKIFSLIFFIVLARIFFIEDYGLLRYLISLAGIFAVILASYSVALTKTISKNKSKLNSLFSNTLFVVLLLLIPIIAISLFLENSLYLILLIIGLTYDWMYFGLVRGLKNFKKLAFFKSSANLFKLLLLIPFILYFKNISILTTVLIFSFSSLISIILLEAYQRTNLKFSLKYISKKQIKTLSKFAFSLILASVAYEIMFNIDTLFIKYFLGSSQVAYYSVARTINQAFTFLPLAIATILMPKISSISNKKSIFKNLKKGLLASFLSSISILILLIIFSKLIITIVFTNKYLPSLSIIPILAVGQVFLMSYIIIESVWQGMNKPRVPALILLTASIFNIVGNYILIPILGIQGAAISTALASILTFLLASIIFYKNEIKQTTAN